MPVMLLNRYSSRLDCLCFTLYSIRDLSLMYVYIKFLFGQAHTLGQVHTSEHQHRVHHHHIIINLHIIMTLIIEVISIILQNEYKTDYRLAARR